MQALKVVLDRIKAQFPRPIVDPASSDKLSILEEWHKTQEVIKGHADELLFQRMLSDDLNAIDSFYKGSACLMFQERVLFACHLY